MAPASWPGVPVRDDDAEEWASAHRSWRDICAVQAAASFEGLCGRPRCWSDVIYASTACRRVLAEEAMAVKDGGACIFGSLDIDALLQSEGDGNITGMF